MCRISYHKLPSVTIFCRDGKAQEEMWTITGLSATIHLHYTELNSDHLISSAEDCPHSVTLHLRSRVSCNLRRLCSTMFGWEGYLRPERKLWGFKQNVHLCRKYTFCLLRLYLLVSDIYGLKIKKKLFQTIFIPLSQTHILSVDLS